MLVFIFIFFSSSFSISSSSMSFSSFYFYSCLHSLSSSLFCGLLLLHHLLLLLRLTFFIFLKYIFNLKNIALIFIRLYLDYPLSFKHKFVTIVVECTEYIFDKCRTYRFLKVFVCYF